MIDSSSSIHSVQPQLSLRLETTRSKPLCAASDSLSTTHSMLLSVCYDPHYTSPQRSQPIVLDSFDLMSFSTSLIRSHCPPDELPLKGVFKDEIVGLRYLSVDEMSGKSEFKRAQFKFEGKEERERFMGSVKGIIPFKLAESSTKTTYTTETNVVPPPHQGRSKGQTRRNRKSTTASNTQQRIGLNSDAASHPFYTDQSQQPSSSQHAHYDSHFDQSSPFLPPAPPQEPSQFPSQSLPPLPQRAFSTLPLPPHLTSHLPRLASAQAQSIERNERSSPSQALLGMDEQEFSGLLGECLFEEGFEELIERVKGSLELR